MYVEHDAYIQEENLLVSEFRINYLPMKNKRKKSEIL